MVQPTDDALFAAAALDAVSGTMDVKDVEGGFSNDSSSNESGAVAGAAVSHMLKAFGRRAYRSLTVDNVKDFGRSARAQVTADGFLSVNSFSVPKADQVLSRVQRNVRDFYKPYSAVFAVAAIYNVITSGWLLIGLLLLAIVYMFFFHVYKGVPVKVGESVLEAPQKSAVFTTLSLVVFIFCGVLTHILSVIFYGSAVSFLHAAFHKGKAQIKQVGEDPEQEKMVLEPGMGAPAMDDITDMA